MKRQYKAPFVAKRRAIRLSMYQSLKIEINDAKGQTVAYIQPDLPDAHFIADLIAQLLDKHVGGL